MSNELTKAAPENLGSQLGEALFGNPGMTLTEIANRREEVAGMRVDSARYRWLRDQSPWSDAKNPCPYSEGADGEIECITAGLDDKIDAAMGEQQ